MKFFRKSFLVVLAIILVLSMAACNKADTSSQDKSATDNTDKVEEVSYDKVVYAYATFNNIPTEEVLSEVEEAINVITREKIGAEIELMPIAIWDYSSQVSLGLQGGEKIDVFQSLGDFNVAVSTSKCLDITDMMDEYATELKELIGEDWLAACSFQGRQFGIPTYKPIALTPMVVYRQDIVNELGIDMSKVNSVSDMTSVLQQVKDAYPDMTPLAAVNTGNIGLGGTLPDIDYLTDDYYSPKGVLMNDELTVVNYYASDEFAQVCGIARSWYTGDLVMKDAATTSSTAAELMSAGNYFAYIASYSYPEEDTAASLEAQCGEYDLGAKMIGSAFLGTDAINVLTWMVSSTSDVSESALGFLNLTFTDKDVVNLLIYGLEGRDYIKNDDSSVSYPEGLDPSTVPYTAQLACGTLGNFFIMYPMAGTSVESLEWELEQNKNAKTSIAMGFTFDSSSVKTEYTAVTNVIDQFLPGLICGSINPESEIPIFLERLEEAGLGTIIAEKQDQLDEWAANK